MHSYRLMAAALLLATGTSAAAQSRDCLHGQLEMPADRARREKAVDLAHAINSAEASRRGPIGRGPFVPFEQLNLPATPAGFQVQFHLDGSKYAFSIKDTRDPCGYAIFSDQDAEVYEAVPSPPKGGVKLLPVR